jgi:hypothetical protein
MWASMVRAAAHLHSQARSSRRRSAHQHALDREETFKDARQTVTTFALRAGQQTPAPAEAFLDVLREQLLVRGGLQVAKQLHGECVVGRAGRIVRSALGQTPVPHAWSASVEMHLPSLLVAAAVDLLLAVWLGSATFGKGAPSGLLKEFIIPDESPGAEVGALYNGSATAAIQELLTEQAAVRQQRGAAAMQLPLVPAMPAPGAGAPPSSSAAASGNAAGASSLLPQSAGLGMGMGMGSTRLVQPHQPLEGLPGGAGEPVTSFSRRQQLATETRIVTLPACEHK